MGISILKTLFGKGQTMRRILKITSFLLAILFLTGFLSACQSTTEEPAPPSDAQGDDTQNTTGENTPAPSAYTSPLTGLGCEQSDTAARPVAFMIDNEVNYFSGQYSNLGLSSADLIFETNIESNGSGTRMMAVFAQSTLENEELEIGAVRSARPYFLQLAKMLDAFYIHEGSSSTDDVLPSSITAPGYYARTMLRQGYVDSYELAYDGKISYRPEAEIREKLSVVSSAVVANAKNALGKLKELYPRTSYQTSDNRVFCFGTADLTSSSAAQSVRIRFSDDNAFYTQSKFTYDADSALYVRSQYLYKSGSRQNPYPEDIVSRDIKTGETLTFKNVFVLSTNQYACDRDYDGRPYHTKVDLIGCSGEGFYFTEGKCVKITWKCDSDTAPIKFYTENGRELVVNPGKTFVNLINQNALDSLEIA